MSGGQPRHDGAAIYDTLIQTQDLAREILSRMEAHIAATAQRQAALEARLARIEDAIRASATTASDLRRTIDGISALALGDPTHHAGP